LMFNHALLKKWLGITCMREKVGVELWWTLNLAGRGVGGVLMSLLGCMGWGYGRILRGVGGSFLILPNLR
jgi:hypothetical protein